MGGESRAVVMVNKMESALRRRALVSRSPSVEFWCAIGDLLAHYLLIGPAVQKCQARF